MSFQVLGCPNCQQPFQVSDEQAGQVVQCPSCAQAVEIPANAIQAPPTPPPQDQQVFACPACNGQFGITADMFGQQVGCPHCQANVLLQAPGADVAPPEPEVEAGLRIDTSTPASRRKKKKKIVLDAPASAPASASASDAVDDVKDLFAPGFKSKKKAAPSEPDVGQVQPTRRSSEPSKSPAKPQPSSGPAPKPAPKPASKPASKPKPVSPEPESTPPPERPIQPVVVESVLADSVEPPTATDEPATLTDRLGELMEAGKDPVDHLLPPRFDVLDPSRMRMEMGKGQFKVLLPDGKGGSTQFDQRVMHVEHEGHQVSLISLSPEQRARRRLIQNIIAIVIGIVIMAIAFTILR